MRFVKLVLLGATISAWFFFASAGLRSAIADDYSTGYYLSYSPSERLVKLFDAILDCYYELPSGEIPKSDDYYPLMQINYSKLKALEARFGDMPEYWEVRWAYLDPGSELRTKSKDKQYSESELARLCNKILFKAVELSKRDPHYLFLYITNYRPETEEEALKFEEISADRLKEAIARDPDEATYHYFRAYYLWRIGEIDQALQEFDAGNRATKYSDHSLMFPRTYAIALSEKLAENPDAYNPQKVLKILHLLTTIPVQNYIKLKDINKEALVAFYLGGGWEMVNILHRHAVRMGTRKWAPRIERLTAYVLIESLPDSILSSGVYANLSSLDAHGYFLLGHQLGRLSAILTRKPETSSELNTFYGATEAGEETHFDSNQRKVSEFVMKRIKGILSEFQLDPAVEYIFERVGKFDYANPAGFLKVLGE